jgi:hypothetical protein
VAEAGWLVDMKVSLILAAIGLAAWSQPANAFTGECLLRVGQRSYIDGRCDIQMDRDGSFTIGASERGIPNGYFAMVAIERKGIASGYWNEEKGANHAHTPLGSLTQRGGCWTNEKAKVCAWKLGSRPR